MFVQIFCLSLDGVICLFTTELYPGYWSLVRYVLQVFSASGFLQKSWVLDLLPGGAYVGARLEVMWTTDFGVARCMSLTGLV